MTAQLNAFAAACSAGCLVLAYFANEWNSPVLKFASWIGTAATLAGAVYAVSLLSGIPQN